MSDIKRGEDTQLEAKCPQCAGPMANMGLDFESPKQTDIKKWAHIKSLYKAGITYHNCGCYGPGYIPSNKEQLIAYLKELIQGYNKELEFWRNREEPTQKQAIESDRGKAWNYHHKVPPHFRPKGTVIKNQEGIDYWISKIKEVETKLAVAGND